MGASSPSSSGITPEEQKAVYERHERRRAILVPLGVACLVASFGAASLCMMLPATESKDASFLATLLDRIIYQESDDKLDVTFDDAHITATIALIAFVAVGVVILAYARNDRSEFYSAFPNLRIPYSADEARAARAVRTRCTGIGCILLAASIATAIVLRIVGWVDLGDGIAFVVGAIGIGTLLHGGMVAKHVDMVAYDYDALKHSNSYYLTANLQGPGRDAVIEAKRRILKAQGAMLVIMTGTALASLVLLLLPSLHTKWFWVPLAAGLLASYAIDRDCMRRSRADLEADS